MSPWADQPFNLIPIKSLKSSNQGVKWVASEMANAHNRLLRALNSIYNQAPYVKLEADIHDLLQYSIFWAGWIEEHHQGEEKFFFPTVERISGDHGVMSRNVEQHHAFLPGLEAFETYEKACIDKKNHQNYNSKTFRKQIESFASVMAEHLKDEIVTLIGLEACDPAAVKKAWVEFDLKMRNGDKAVLFPIVMGSADASFEGETLWPQVPGPVRYLVHYYFERKYRPVWRFCPSDTWGVRKEFAFGPRAETA